MVLAIAAVLLVSVQWMLTPYASWSTALARAGVSNPVETSWATAPVVGRVELVVALAAVTVSLLSLVARWRSADPEGRQQLKWLGLGAVTGVALFFLAFALGPVATALALVPLPAACLVAALRHGLWDVDVVISRSLIYVALMTLVVAVYAGVVALAGGALGAGTGAPIIATALVAVLALPLHRRLSVLVNRLVHGEQDEPVVVLQRLGDRLAAAQDDGTLAERVLPDVVAVVARTLHMPYVAVRLADGTEVARGQPPADVVRTPLVYAGTDVGSLVVATRPSGLPDADRRMLAVLAQQAAVAVHTVVLARELRRSRERR
jgi:two-component system NarL family sensor kinase